LDNLFAFEGMVVSITVLKMLLEMVLIMTMMVVVES
jgi:hypothetical protein